MSSLLPVIKYPQNQLFHSIVKSKGSTQQIAFYLTPVKWQAGSLGNSTTIHPKGRKTANTLLHSILKCKHKEAGFD